MPLPSNLLGILFALTSAFVWGGGDFTGGYAARRSSQYHVLSLAAFSGLVVLVISAVVFRENFPSWAGMLWAMLAGVSGSVGMAALYRALSQERAASIAPTTAVIGAVIPVVYSAFAEGLPAPQKLAGFGLAFAGIWLVSAGSSAEGAATRRGFFLACLAGLGFGGFFTFLGLVDRGIILTPLIVARSFTLITGLILVRLNRLPFPSIRANPPALLAGLLDAGGNLFYILARQYTRLDIAAVLASLYPASTVFLATLIFKESVSRRQGLGVLICLAAIVLITL